MKQSNIYIVGGGKGGVGKTMTSMALLDWLIHDTTKQGQSITLVETDDSNPDVFKAYEKVEEVNKVIINLDAEGGWIKLMNMMPDWAKSGTSVVINTAARSTQSLAKHLPDFQAGADELKMKVHFMWSINRQRDSLLLLKNVLNAANVQTTVVKNLYFGNAEKFVLFDDSEIAKKVKAIELPDLNDFVSDKIYCDRLPLHATEKFQFGERIALQRFRTSAYEQFNKMA